MTEEALRVLGADQLEAFVRAVKAQKQAGGPREMLVRVLTNGERPPVFLLTEVPREWRRITGKPLT